MDRKPDAQPAAVPVAGVRDAADLPVESRASARVIVDAAVDRYIAGRRQRVDGFIDANYSLAGSLHLHRNAVGRDLLRAPANVVLAVPHLALQLAAATLSGAGADRLAARARKYNVFLDTDVGRELTWRFYTELLELPYADGERASQRDALAEEILRDPSIVKSLHALAEVAVRAASDPQLRDRLEADVRAYLEVRTASAEIVNNAVLAGAGATLFKQLTPGAVSLGPLLAGAVAKHAAVAAFPLGTTAGGLWYGLFPAIPSAALVTGVTGGLVGLGALLSAFAGVVADPLQRACGIHRRRLHRFLDGLESALKGGERTFQARDHYLARVFDILEIARLAARAAL